MSKRTYDQPTCGLATALDLLGERWTLLIVRELLLGPQRYSDLQHSLPGLGTNLLAERLRHLESIGVVRRTQLPPPAASAVYELTELGCELEDVVIGLARWGSRFTCEPCEQTFDPRRQAFAMFARLDRVAARHVDEMYEYRIGEHVITAHVTRGTVTATPAIGRRPDAVLTTDTQGFCELFERGRPPEELASEGRLQIEGDPDCAHRAVALFI